MTRGALDAKQDKTGSVTASQASAPSTSKFALFPPSGPQKTVADDNCAFHAILGERNSTGIYECKNLSAEKKKAANAIRECKSGDPIFPLVKKHAIEAMLMSDRIPGSESIQKIRKEYQGYLEKNKDSVESAWEFFKIKLRENPDILDYIAKQNQSNYGDGDLRKQFQACLNKKDGGLRGSDLFQS